MWPLCGAALVLFCLGPSAAHWLMTRGKQTDAAELWPVYLVIDAAAVLGLGLHLAAALAYAGEPGQQQAPYPGAWMQRDGRQHAPHGFQPYLSFALLASLLAPAGLCALCCLAGDASTRDLALATLAPYLLVFAPQIALEVRLLNRSPLTPCIPVLFTPYRAWQLVRGLGLAAAAGGERGWWMQAALLGLAGFWAFDFGATIAWLPGMFDWPLQDARLLARLAAQRAQLPRVPADSPAAAAKARHRRAGPGGRSGEIDSYGFGA